MPTGFEVYKKYLALKRHFSSDYDYFRYGGNFKVSEETFNKRRDRAQFIRLAEHPHAISYLLANLVEAPDLWIGYLFDDEANNRYDKWRQRTRTIGYQFRTDLETILENGDLNYMLKSDRGEYPPALSLYLGQHICLESLIILDDLLGFKAKWDKEIKEPYIWPTVSKKMFKYKPFMRYKKDKMRDISLELISRITHK